MKAMFSPSRQSTCSVVNVVQNYPVPEAGRRQHELDRINDLFLFQLRALLAQISIG